MDPLSIASAAAGALSLTLQLHETISSLTALYRNYKTVHEQLQELSDNLDAIGSVLSRLEETLTTLEPKSTDEHRLEFLWRPLCSLREALEAVDISLRKHGIVTGEDNGRPREMERGKNHGKNKIFMKLSWVLSGKGELEELSKKIEREKQTLIMAVGIGVLYVALILVFHNHMQNHASNEQIGAKQLRSRNAPAHSQMMCTIRYSPASKNDENTSPKSARDWDVSRICSSHHLRKKYASRRRLGRRIS
jgi:hypothetical protein